MTFKDFFMGVTLIIDAVDYLKYAMRKLLKKRIGCLITRQPILTTFYYHMQIKYLDPK